MGTFAGIDWNKKAGPLPLWGYGAIGGAGIGVVAFIKMRKATKSGSQQQAPLTGDISTGVPDQTGGAATNTGSGSGSGSGTGLDLSSLETELEKILAQQADNNKTVLAAIAANQGGTTNNYITNPAPTLATTPPPSWTPIPYNNDAPQPTINNGANNAPVLTPRVTIPGVSTYDPTVPSKPGGIGVGSGSSAEFPGPGQVQLGGPVVANGSAASTQAVFGRNVDLSAYRKVGV